MKTIHDYRIPEEFDPLQSNLCLLTWCDGCQAHRVTSCDALACGECALTDFCNDCEQCALCCECNVSSYELALRAFNRLPNRDMRPLPYKSWARITGKGEGDYQTMIDKLLISLQADLLALVRRYYRYLAYCNPYPMTYERHKEVCGGGRRRYQEYLEESLDHFKRFAPKDAK